MERFLRAFEGPNGASFDTARILFFSGGIAGVIAPLVYQSVALYMGQNWHPAEFCGGYFGGLGAYLGGGGLGISLKDKGVASAINTTSSQPTSSQP